MKHNDEPKAREMQLEPVSISIKQYVEINIYRTTEGKFKASVILPLKNSAYDLFTTFNTFGEAKAAAYQSAANFFYTTIAEIEYERNH